MKKTSSNPTLKSHAAHIQKILNACHHDPFSFLGFHRDSEHDIVRVFNPFANQVAIKVKESWQSLNCIDANGIFELISNQKIEKPYLLKIATKSGEYETFDPYCFHSSISQDELYLFGEGKLKQAYKTLGAHLMSFGNVSGVRFAVWAPNAERVSVVGDFNQWDGRINSMRSLGSSGIWELFIPNLTIHDIYKFEILNRHTRQIMLKTDPYGFEFEQRPGTASKISQSKHQWHDHAWLTNRTNKDWLHTPFNCYEVHLGSWQRNANGHFLSYRELAKTLVPHVAQMGYTHVELLPISEHPLNESWGYQTTGYFGVTNRFGKPDDLRFLIDAFHQANIGVILDWVPGHFPKDDWALARFDGSALYEHEDPRLGEHQDWGTYIFNYGRNEVRNFLISNAYFWLNEFHIDGLRVDAVASMLYLDYSRKSGEWIPNKFGGRENLDAIDFFRELNIMVGNDFPGVLTIAEESTAWPGVSRPTYTGGLGFSMKWNMGWMNDILSYIEEDPVNRKYHHNKLTFGQLYAYSENFVLPFSHDEVVHGKRSLLNKMPGDDWQQFANLRLLTTLQTTSPGKKLNFMGNEIAQRNEWNVNNSLDWHLLEETHPQHAFHQGIQRIHQDLNHLYLTKKALHTHDFDADGFEWLDCNDENHSILVFARRSNKHSFVIIALNFTPVPRENYRIGVPAAGRFHEIFNSDAGIYQGSNILNTGVMESQSIPWMNQAQSILITLPPLAGVLIEII